MFTESLYASAFHTTRFHKQKHHRLIDQKKISPPTKKTQANCVQPRNRSRRAPATEAEAQLQSEILHCRALNPKLFTFG
jgi:hypothetical protein